MSKPLPPNPPVTSSAGTTPLGQPGAKPVAAPAAPSAIVQELETLIRARYPLIEIITWEEERVLQCLDGIAAGLGKQLWQWTINSGLGLYRAFAAQGNEFVKGTKDPLTAPQGNRLDVL